MIFCASNRTRRYILGRILSVLYNSFHLRRSGLITMPLGGFEQVANGRHRIWRGIVIAFAVAALATSLATRGAHVVCFDLSASAHDNYSFTNVQHRDTDAFGWVSPAPSLSILWAAIPSTPTEFNQPTYFRDLDSPLYNRPPPAL